MEVLEGQNILVTISGKKNRVRVYYLSWLKSKILRTDGLSDVSISQSIPSQFIKKNQSTASGTSQWMDKCWRPARCCTFQNCQIRTNQVFGDRIEGFNRDLRLGAEAISQVYGI
jgi:hypothetical protein